MKDDGDLHEDLQQVVRGGPPDSVLETSGGTSSADGDEPIGPS